MTMKTKIVYSIPIVMLIQLFIQIGVDDIVLRSRLLSTLLSLSGIALSILCILDDQNDRETI